MDSSLIGPLITGGGFAGIIVVLFVTGHIHSDGELKREVERREAVERRVGLLEQALEEKDKALAEANGRADAAVRASELVADAFTDARRRRTSTGRGHGGT